MGIGVDTYSYLHYITIEPVQNAVATGSPIPGNGPAVGAVADFGERSPIGSKVDFIAEFAQTSSFGPVVYGSGEFTQLTDVPLNRFGFRNTINRLKGFLPPQIKQSDFINPRSIPTLSFWLDGSDATTMTLDGLNRVEEWVDKSKSAHIFSQSTVGFRPIASTSGSLIFDGSDDRIFSSTAHNSFDSQGTVIFVYEVSNSSSIRFLLTATDSTASAGNRYCLAYPSRTNNNAGIQTNFADFDTVVEGSDDVTNFVAKKYIVVMRSNDDEYSFRVNGNNQAINIVTGTNNGRWFSEVPGIDNVMVGAADFGPSFGVSNFFSGGIYGIISYTEPLSDSNVELIERYYNRTLNIF